MLNGYKTHQKYQALQLVRITFFSSTETYKSMTFVSKLLTNLKSIDYLKFKKLCCFCLVIFSYLDIYIINVSNDFNDLDNRKKLCTKTHQSRHTLMRCKNSSTLREIYLSTPDFTRLII